MVAKPLKNAEAGPSNPGSDGPSQDELEGGDASGSSDNHPEEERDSDDHERTREESSPGMDPDGFAAPSTQKKVVKTLTPDALAAFRAALERTGVIYISRIPPGMRPTKVRHLMSQYGEVGRVYLQQEGDSLIFLVGSFASHMGAQIPKAHTFGGNTHPRRRCTTQKDGSSLWTNGSLDPWQPCSTLSLSVGRRVHVGVMMSGL